MGRKGTGAANKGALKPVFILQPLIGTMWCPDNRPATPQTATAQRGKEMSIVMLPQMCFLCFICTKEPSQKM